MLFNFCGFGCVVEGAKVCDFRATQFTDAPLLLFTHLSFSVASIRSRCFCFIGGSFGT